MTTSDTSRDGDRAIEFTDYQLANWKSYERVRKGGKFNMFDPRARAATRLDHEEYSFVMRHYSALKVAVEQERASIATSARSETMGVAP
jgi:hypothetical protein